MNQSQIDIIHELGFNLTATTLAAIVAELNNNDAALSKNMVLALDIMTMAGEENAGADEFAQMVMEAEAHR
jgi:hypothetical protein